MLHIRPRFEIPVSYTKEEILTKIAGMLEGSHPQLEGKIVDNHIILDIAEEELHYWSPHLDFRVEEDEWHPEQVFLRGLIGPRPAVWTMFMFIYFTIGAIGFAISSFGISKWLLGELTLYLWAFPIAIVFMLTAYSAGKYGESLGKDQTEILKQFIRDAINP